MIAAERLPASARPAGLAHAEPFRLGGLEVRPPTREVISPQLSILLEPRVMQVFVLLAAHRGQVVSRADLTEQCWAGQVVGDDAINRCIQAIRRLAERSGGFSIRTVARVGYRLDEEIGGGGPVGLVRRDLAPPGGIGPGERRRLTVLSCSPVLPGGNAVDLEARYEIVRKWRQTVVDRVAPFGAHVDHGRGERVIVCFGYPDALEDAAERAVRAGLAAIEGMDALNARLGQEHGAGLAMRVAVHADEAMIGCRPDGGIEFFGAAIDGAIALEARSEAGSLAITGQERGSRAPARVPGE
jgi:DNA-binding winged helix-turn-helix (wHTH) protein